MNYITVSDNIFYNSKVSLDYLMSNKNLDSEKLDSVGWIQLRITGEGNDDKFDDFLNAFIDRLKLSYELYFIYSQNIKAKKSRARSYAKLFYYLRKQEGLKNAAMEDKEIDLGPGYSTMAGIIEANRIDPEIIIDELMSNNFRYGYCVQSNRSNNDLKYYLNLLDEELYEEDESLRLNNVKLIEKFINPFSFLYSYMYTGSDDLLFTIYSGKEVYNDLESIITDIISETGQIEKKVADSKETDEIVDMYFSYPRFRKR